MMCSIFTLGKTVQDVTREILYIVEHYEFPDCPFLIKGPRTLLCQKINGIRSDIILIKALIEWWLEDRFHENWKMEDSSLPQRILGSLKEITMDDVVLCSVVPGGPLEESHHAEILFSYILRLNRIKENLSRWMGYLILQEIRRNEEIFHISLKGRWELHEK